jgi:RNA polymerase subunit RPABC4/transcription elongation factor Spt4
MLLGPKRSSRLDIEALVARGLQILLALGGAYLIATWFVLAIWTFRDIESRSRSVITQVFSTLLVVLFWVPGMMLYWLLRPKETLDEAYQRSLEEEYLLQDLEEMPLCPSCHHFVEDEWQLCPHCNTQLREPCPSCERLIDLRWDICPYCGTAHHGHTHDHDEKSTGGSEERWVDPAVIEKRLRDAEVRRIREETKALPAVTAASADDRRDYLDSFRRLDVLRDSPTNGEESPTQQEAEPAVILNGRVPSASGEGPLLGPDLSEISEATDDDREIGDPEKVPDRFKVR